MTAQQLKNAILQEAIEGRLVPQGPNDEPASALLARIRKEKEQLVKAGKLKKSALKEVPFSEDEIPFDIPESWEWVRLGDIADIVRGGSPRPAGSPEFYGGNIPFLKVADLTKDETMYVNTHTATIKEAGLKKTREVESDTLLLTNSGATLGVPKICTFRTTFNDGIAAFLYLLDDLKPYLYWFLCSKTEAFRNINQGTAQPNLNTDIIKSTLFPMPPLEEQRRIISKIEELLPKVEEYGKAQDALNKLNAELPERLKKSILQEAIEGRLVPQDPNDEPASVLLAKIRKEKEQLVKAGKLKKKDLIETPITEDEIPFEIPESWEWCNLFDCVDILYGYPFDSTAFNENGAGFPLIRIRDIVPSSTKTYTTEKAEDRYVIKRGDMLVGMDGNFNVCFWQSDDAYLNQRVCKITTKESILNQKFLYYYLPYELEEIFKTVSYVTVKHLSDKHFRTMRIPLPPLAEQHRIVEKLEQLLGKIYKLKK